MIDVVDKERQGLDPKLAQIVDEKSQEKKGYVYCAMCSHIISHQDNATEINGSHQHQCTNPHGFVFDIDCYSDALGCAISGESTHADSWFAGYMWVFANCTECSQHLGWLFENDQNHFYGLIRDRIQSE